MAWQLRAVHGTDFAINHGKKFWSGSPQDQRSLEKWGISFPLLFCAGSIEFNHINQSRVIIYVFCVLLWLVCILSFFISFNLSPGTALKLRVYAQYVRMYNERVLKGVETRQWPINSALTSIWQAPHKYSLYFSDDVGNSEQLAWPRVY